MSGWDWIDAGLSVLIFNKANKAQKNLQAMQQNAELAEFEKQMLSEMRDYIFSISKEVQLIEKEIENSPEQSYIVSKAIERKLGESGLSADLFPEIQDKEYFFKTETLINDVITKSEKQLDSTQKENGDKAVNYIFDLLYLKPAIKADEARSFLKQTEVEWAEKSKIHSKNSNLKIFGIIGLVASFMVTCVLGAFSIGLFSNGGFGSILGAIVLIIIIIGFWIGSILMISLGSRKNPGWKDLKEEREGKIKDLLTQEQQQIVREKFGDVSGTELTNLLESRLDFLESKLGDRLEALLG